MRLDLWPSIRSRQMIERIIGGGPGQTVATALRSGRQAHGSLAQVRDWWALLICAHQGISSASARVHVVWRIMRVLASGLILNATFPFDVLAQKPAATSAQPAAGQPFSPEQLDALLASI